MKVVISPIKVVIETRRNQFVFANMVVGFQCHGISWDVERDMNQLISHTCLNFRVKYGKHDQKGQSHIIVQF